MAQNHPFSSFSQINWPKAWLVSDARNDAMLEDALAKLPRRSGFIYRHYHLSEDERWARFCDLRQIFQSRDTMVILADSAQTAREWGAHGVYGPALTLYPKRRDLIQLASAHNAREIAAANRKNADAVLLSPVFPTQSHPGSKTLGTMRFRTLAKLAQMPVIALGGMTHRNAALMGWSHWAAIDGLSQ